jgi:hypothetical protein
MAVAKTRQTRRSIQEPPFITPIFHHSKSRPDIFQPVETEVISGAKTTKKGHSTARNDGGVEKKEPTVNGRSQNTTKLLFRTSAVFRLFQIESSWERE